MFYQISLGGGCDSWVELRGGMGLMCFVRLTLVEDAIAGLR